LALRSTSIREALTLNRTFRFVLLRMRLLDSTRRWKGFDSKPDRVFQLIVRLSTKSPVGRNTSRIG
jgi:hypothetical protein